MSDDASYASFLNKANQTPSAPANKTQHTSPFSTSQARPKYDPTSTTTKPPLPTLPPSLSALTISSKTYTSDTDSPFEPVEFVYGGSALPSSNAFAETCLCPAAHQDQVEELQTDDWDPRGEYGEVVQAVREAGDGSALKIYRVERGGTRVEYYVVTLVEGKILGVVTRAVES